METIGKVVVGFITFIIKAIIVGFVFAKLWLWFIVVKFNLPPLTLLEALGIIVLVGYIRAEYKKQDEREDLWNSLLTHFLFVVIISAMTLLGGWCIKLLM
jgi:hypothetical protein